MLKHHPNNPRKNLGDLQELTDSIRKNGILQNLTIIPIKNDKCTTIDLATEYWVLIGNRRFEAGMAAGVEQFPCNIIEDLSEREQLSIMLEENIQRTDLTILEQAEGFQMMLDLGGSVESISEKTGFSQSTIYHRLNIAKLDKDKLEKKQQSFQLTISDLYELEKIKDIETRNKILERSLSSNDIKIQADREYRNQVIQENLEKWKTWIEREGIAEAPEEYRSSSWSVTKDPESTTSKWIELGEAGLEKDFDEFWEENKNFRDTLIRDDVFWFKPDWASYIKFYVANENYGMISEDEQVRREEEEKIRAERNKNDKILRNLEKEFKKTFQDFVVRYLAGEIKNPEGKRGPLLTEYLWERLLKFEAVLERCVVVESYLMLYPEESEKAAYQLEKSEEEALYRKIENMSMQEQMLMILNKEMSDCGSPVSWNGTWDGYSKDKYIEARNILWTFGIKLSDEMDAFVFGEHEAYASSEED